MDAPLLVISPTLGERENLPALAAALWEAVPEAYWLLVDDDSGDGTPEWARKQPQWGSKLHLIERPAPAGLGSAYRDGFRWAMAREFEFLVQMDGDLSHDAADIPRLLEAAKQGAHLVLGSRAAAASAHAGSRRALSQAGAMLCRRLLGLPFDDPTGGFKCWRREAVVALNVATLRSRGFAFQIESTHRAARLGLAIAEVPVVVRERRAGASKLDGAIVVEAVRLMFRLARERRASLAEAAAGSQA